MKQSVLVVSHADADGHVIAEQVRRNLATVDSFNVTTLIDPERTKDHKAWLHLDALQELEKSEIVFFVDLMFAPASFGQEADALVRFATDRPSKRFFVLDHHPLPLRRLASAKNIRALYRRDVCDCTFGPPSRMMVLAALCEKQPTRARQIKTPMEDVVAQGLRRAAALGGPLPGAKLSALLRFNEWRGLEALGQEDRAEHRLPRGRRPRDARPSPALAELDKTATELLKSSGKRPERARAGGSMSYDFDAALDQGSPTVATPTPQPHDLEGIMMLLELAAIYLTPAPETEFTLDDLLREAKAIGGEEVELDEADAMIVLDKATFLKKFGKKKFSLK
jgi:hypothetical protein